MDHTQVDKLQNEWERQSPMIEAILQKGMQDYVAALQNVHAAFQTNVPTLCCIDEGTPFGIMRSAGSGILVEGESRIRFLEHLKQAGVKDVASHTGCGAVALYREKMGITDLSVDEVAQEGAQRIARELGVPYQGHITELKRPKEFHNARVVYVDGTGSFNPSVVDGFPTGFVVSRKFMTPEQAQQEVEIVVSIALGKHGFGEKFSKEEPLLLIVIGDEILTTKQLKQEVKDFVQDLPVRIEEWDTRALIG